MKEKEYDGIGVLTIGIILSRKAGWKRCSFLPSFWSVGNLIELAVKCWESWRNYLILI